MSKEAVRTHDQGPLSQTNLEVKNREFGGRLFSTFKAGREKTLIFPTSFTRVNGNIYAEEFLVITVDGPKAIQAVMVGTDEDSVGFANAEAIEDLITRRLGKNLGFFSFSNIIGSEGYKRSKDAETLHIGRLWITEVGTNRFYSDENYDPRCSLISIDENHANQILQLNIERAKKAQAASLEDKDIKLS